ncbi:hypothetical protein D3C79_501880 [compost metagenome]
MRDRDEQGVWLHDHFAVAELAGHFYLARNTGQAFQPVTRDHTRVVAGATGHDLNIAHLGEQVGSIRAEGLDQDIVLAQTAFQGALNHAWLLVDFFEHEVTVGTLVRRFRAFVVLHGLALDLVAGLVPDAHLVTANLGDVAFFQVHEAVGDLAQGQLVGGQEVFTQAQADHQRAAAACGEQTIRLSHADQRQTVSTVQALDRSLEGIGQVRDGLEGVLDQVDDNFGIGLRGEHIAEVLELFAQLLVVLDDAVVHDRNFVSGEMRVSIRFARRAVGSPARVGDAQLAGDRFGSDGGFQLGDLANAAAALQRALLGVDGQTGAVVATVLEALEAFDENGSDITLGYGTDDSTHVYCSWLIAAQIRLMPRA